MWSQRKHSSRGAEVEERFRKERKSELTLERCGINQRKEVKRGIQGRRDRPEAGCVSLELHSVQLC